MGRLLLTVVVLLQIINVTEDSPEHVWTRMIAEVKAATFVAIDTEFSGIGSMKTTRDKDMEVRYTAMRSAVQSHGLLQLGLSIWRRIDRETTGSAAYDTARYFVTSYCIPVLPSEDFSVTPNSLQFLAEAGIDLSQLCRDGVRFKKPVRAVSRGTASSPMGERCLRDLMGACYTRPFVTHNGLLDLMFLYEAFTGPLPKKLGQFIAEGVKLYRGQLLDTKCIAEYSQRPPWSPSYLELLYARARRLCTAAATETPVQAHLKFLAKAKKSSTSTPKGSRHDDGSSTSPRKHDDTDTTGGTNGVDGPDISGRDGSAKRRRLADDGQDSSAAASAEQICQVCPNYACVTACSCLSAVANAAVPSLLVACRVMLPTLQPCPVNCCEVSVQLTQSCFVARLRLAARVRATLLQFFVSLMVLRVWLSSTVFAFVLICMVISIALLRVLLQRPSPPRLCSTNSACPLAPKTMFLMLALFALILWLRC